MLKFTQVEDGVSWTIYIDPSEIALVGPVMSKENDEILPLTDQSTVGVKTGSKFNLIQVTGSVEEIAEKVIAAKADLF